MTKNILAALVLLGSGGCMATKQQTPVPPLPPALPRTVPVRALVVIPGPIPVPIEGVIIPYTMSPTNCTYHLETSTNLVTWTELTNFPGGGGGVGFYTNWFDGSPQKFFRIRITR